MLGDLLVYADNRNLHLGHQYGVRIDWAYRDKECNKRIGGHPRSLHRSRLAIDLIVDRYFPGRPGRWVLQKKRTPFHALLHEFWESIGGAEEIPGDSGHFSLPHGGMR